MRDESAWRAGFPALLAWIAERAPLLHHFRLMVQSKLERAAWLRNIAAEFRAHAAQTEWPAYRTRMLDMAADLELEAAKLDRYRRFSIAS